MMQKPKKEESNTTSNRVAGACDAHVHVYGPLDRYPSPTNTEYTIPDAVPEQLFSTQDSVGISRAVVVNAASASPDNQRLFDVLKEYPRRLRGIATIPVLAPSDTQLQEWDDLGVRGVRFSYVGTDVKPFDERLIARIAELGWHVQLQVENNQILELESKLHRLPCDVVIDHMGRIPAALGVESEPFQCLLRLISSGKIWVKLSAPMRYSDETTPPYNDVKPMAQALVQENPDRLVWGSDWPHVNYKGNPPRYEDLLDLLAHWVPDTHLYQKILSDNPQKLYSFIKNA